MYELRLYDEIGDGFVSSTSSSKLESRRIIDRNDYMNRLIDRITSTDHIPYDANVVSVRGMILASKSIDIIKEVLMSSIVKILVISDCNLAELIGVKGLENVEELYIDRCILDEDTTLNLPKLKGLNIRGIPSKKWEFITEDSINFGTTFKVDSVSQIRRLNIEFTEKHKSVPMIDLGPLTGLEELSIPYRCLYENIKYINKDLRFLKLSYRDVPKEINIETLGINKFISKFHKLHTLDTVCDRLEDVFDPLRNNTTMEWIGILNTNLKRTSIIRSDYRTSKYLDKLTCLTITGFNDYVVDEIVNRCKRLDTLSLTMRIPDKHNTRLLEPLKFNFHNNRLSMVEIDCYGLTLPMGIPDLKESSPDVKLILFRFPLSFIIAHPDVFDKLPINTSYRNILVNDLSGADIEMCRIRVDICGRPRLVKAINLKLRKLNISPLDIIQPNFSDIARTVNIPEDNMNYYSTQESFILPGLRDHMRNYNMMTTPNAKVIRSRGRDDSLLPKSKRHKNQEVIPFLISRSDIEESRENNREESRNLNREQSRHLEISRENNQEESRNLKRDRLRQFKISKDSDFEILSYCNCDNSTYTDSKNNYSTEESQESSDNDLKDGKVYNGLKILVRPGCIEGYEEPPRKKPKIQINKT